MPAAPPQLLLIMQRPDTYPGEPSHTLLGAPCNPVLPALGSHGALCKAASQDFVPSAEIGRHLLRKHL